MRRLFRIQNEKVIEEFSTEGWQGRRPAVGTGRARCLPRPVLNRAGRGYRRSCISPSDDKMLHPSGHLREMMSIGRVHNLRENPRAHIEVGRAHIDAGHRILRRDRSDRCPAPNGMRAYRKSSTSSRVSASLRRRRSGSSRCSSCSAYDTATGGHQSRETPYQSRPFCPAGYESMSSTRQRSPWLRLPAAGA